jgi:hypothetical protein
VCVCVCVCVVLDHLDHRQVMIDYKDENPAQSIE